MSRPGVYLAMADPVAPEVEELCNGWYERHMSDSLLLPGRSSARRYRRADVATQLAPDLVGGARHRYITVYELDDIGTVPEARALMPWLAKVSAEPTSPTLDTEGMIASVYEQCSEHTTASALPDGVDLAGAGEVPDGPPAVVLTFSRPASDADDGDDRCRCDETLMVPGCNRWRRFRLAAAAEQMVPRRADCFERRCLTIFDVSNANHIPLARQAMRRGASIGECWTYEQIFETARATTLPDGVVHPRNRS